MDCYILPCIIAVLKNDILFINLTFFLPPNSTTQNVPLPRVEKRHFTVGSYQKVKKSNYNSQKVILENFHPAVPVSILLHFQGRGVGEKEYFQLGTRLHKSIDRM